MAFIKTDKSMDDILLGTHTDYVTPWVTVHDEVDYSTLKFLKTPIMKDAAHLTDLSDIIAKFKLPGLSLSYDVEFDEWDSWTASSDVNVYDYPGNHVESEYISKLAKSKLNDIKVNLDESNIKVTGKIITIPINKVNESTLKSISELEDGLDSVIIESGKGSYFHYERKVNYTL